MQKKSIPEVFPHAGRRLFLQCAGAMLVHSAVASGFPGAKTPTNNKNVFYGQNTLPAGIRSRLVDNNNGVRMHVLEAGFEQNNGPCIVFLHGFPELGYTWRNQLLPLAEAGFHVIAPDLRGYGLSVSRPAAFDDDLLPYTQLNRVSDVVGLVRAIGYKRVAAVVGHDWGGPTAQWCARMRPDVFQSVVSMSTPFLRAPGPPRRQAAPEPEMDIDEQLAALPRPRQHYFSYSASRAANANMWYAPQGVHDLLRALYHYKSADWKGNKPFPLKSWAAAELAKMPAYYIMDLDKGIAETMATAMPSKSEIATCRWMTEQDLQVYSTEFIRTGFQGGLNYYRVGEDARFNTELSNFAGRTIDVPSCYIGGDREWAVYQTPGAFEAMHKACTRLLSVHLVKDAGHSVAEEQPGEVTRLISEFLRRAQKA